MKRIEMALTVALVCIAIAVAPRSGRAQPVAPLPDGARAVWDLDQAFREATPTRERICINGLWRWQPATEVTEDAPIPEGGWGHFKVPGSWPGITDYMQKDAQTVHAHPDWADVRLRDITAAWHQREIAIPAQWAGRRILLSAEYVNSFAVVYVDGERAGEIRFPSGEVDLTALCRPGETHMLTLLVEAMPLRAVMLSYNDTASAREVEGSVRRRGLCGDVYLVGRPDGAHVMDVKITTSVRNWEITIEAGLEGLAEDRQHVLRAAVMDEGRVVQGFTSEPFGAADLTRGRFAFTRPWRPEKLWDTHTPGNTYLLHLSLLGVEAWALDVAHPVRFGFREFWIDGRDFMLNGSRIFLSTVPLDNAQVSAALASYEGARESLERLQSFGINFVYGHNYGCEPGSHLSFAEVLQAADDLGMLVALSQPHFGHYDWDAPDADEANGYALHAEFYVRVAQNHPSVVAYSTSHNATGYAEDMNPDLIDGVQSHRHPWSQRNVDRALRAEAIIRSLDADRIIYHHSSGNLSSMHTSNFYPNFVPIQELSDWFEHWATNGVKPVFLCEYGAPFSWDWTMYRGWYDGRRAFGSARVPWEYCLAEWTAQFHGDRAYDITEMEKQNLRWEARQFREGRVWHRWDYPHQVGSRVFRERQEVMGRYITDNWRAHRTWGISANSPWEHGHFWDLREGLDRLRRVDLEVDWDNLQRPGLSPDYIEGRYERMDLAYEREDWVATPAAEALLRNNMPLLAYIAGGPERFTTRGHNFLPGETVSKQLIIINNSREAVTCRAGWALDLPQALRGSSTVTVPTGEQAGIPLQLNLPAGLAPGQYELSATFEFDTGEAQADAFAVHVLPPPGPPGPVARVALFDPAGETAAWLEQLGVGFRRVDAVAELSGDEVLVVGKGALTVDGPAPDISSVREGLRVVMFEQTAQVLEQRFGFRVTEYGLREVFPRVPDHPLLEGLSPEHLRDWRGEATIIPPRLEYELGRTFNYVPTIKWCGIEVPRAWRCGTVGNVVSVLIEKPARGDFLPVLDGGYSLQYSPLMEYREGSGMVLLCQLDVTGRTESDPAAETLARNIIHYVSGWTPAPRRAALYVGDAEGRRHLGQAGIAAGEYEGGPLSPEQALIVGPGGGQDLAAYRAAIAAWLEAGGRLLAVGLDEAQANAFLPFTVGTQTAEHINAWFEPPGAGSPLAGVGPADVHNRDPRDLPLLTGGAQLIGNGVLGVADEAHVVFCQLVPWEFDHKPMNHKRTYRRASFLLTRLSANMGVAGQAPLLDRFSSPVAPDNDEQRWREGLYLDEPEEWDDPYRFFRW